VAEAKRILVTGASGFVGRHLCSVLRRRGDVVREALRAAPGNEPASPDRVVIGDLGPETDWSAAVQNVSAVVHLAARVHVMDDRAADPLEAFRRVNVRGTETLARAAARAGATRFVFVSSVKVNGEATSDRPYSESDTPAPVDAYGQSKWEAEQRLARVAAETGMPVTILRPPLVYGPEVKANFLQLLRAIDRGIPLPLASIHNRRSLIHVGNFVDAIHAALTHPAAANRTYLVSDGDDVSTPELVRRIAEALGRSPRLLPCPPALLRALGVLAGRSDQVARLTDSLELNIDRIRSELGWRPPFSMRDGLAETARWYRAQRL